MYGCCKVTHGMAGTRIYYTWKNMKARCFNVNNSEFKNYGGRGITVCDEWKENFESFYLWAMENGYEDVLTIERIDVNGHYCPKNCCWIPKEMQGSNTTKNNKITFNNKTRTLSQWARLYDIPIQTLRSRMYKLGYSFADAVKKDKNRSKSSVIIQFDGNKLTQTEFACVCGCTKHWIYRMRKMGYSPQAMYEKTEKFRQMTGGL